ncbi:kinase-like domain-containing protein [Hygrophoropsis aurantiaca]|uniref:Kinase-like domain-containing protein n=1 Tax=Hygrophoropsis aurantiaca TaxID=72124 RepID=A0ACB7ZZK5_9AGAM|nr:kinase-like domain-containing protein [Hygrophoropsis aurantiaca]
MTGTADETAITVTELERLKNYYRHYVDIENVNYYRKGGYHPVHIGDIIHNRYRVVNKLGYGGYSTVWLVKDLDMGRYASLKVIVADASKNASEVTLLRHLKEIQTNLPDIPGGEFVMKVFDDFIVDGPNGTHQCIVTEVLGLPLDPNPLEVKEHIYPIDMAKKMVAQIAQGVAYLHRIGIVHGDLHIKNIVLHAPEMENLSDQDVQKYFDRPWLERPECREEYSKLAISDPDHRVPQHVVYAGLSNELVALLFDTVHIKICDFGEAFLWHGVPRQIELHTPNAHAAPEILFGDPVTPAVDIWSMAVLAHLILSGVYMFEPPGGGSVEFEWVLKLGKMPDRWWPRWIERGISFDDDGVYIAGEFPMDVMERESALMTGSIGRRMREDEVIEFEQLVRRMVCYEVEDRISADGVVQSIPADWIKGGKEHWRRI